LFKNDIYRSAITPLAVYFNGLLDNVVSFANMNNFTNAMAQESG